MKRVEFVLALAAAAAGPPRQGGTLRMAADVLGTNLDPYADAISGIDTLAWLFGDGLVSFDGERVRPSLARTLPTVSRDGLRVRYDLRDDVRWHDGTRFGARDVRDCLERVAASAWASNLPYGAIEHVEVQSQFRLIVHLRRRSPGFVETFFAPYGSPALPLLKPGNLPVGTGPFRVTRDRSDTNAFRLEAYAGSPRGVPRLATIALRLEDVNASGTIGLATSEVDLAFPLSRAQTGLRGIRTLRYDAATLYLVANLAGPMRDRTLRIATFSAIDFARLRRVIYGEMSQTEPSLVPKSAIPGVPTTALSYAPERAVRYFRSHRSPAIQIAVEPGRLERAAVVIADDLRRAGARAEIQRFDGRAFYTENGPVRSGRFDLTIDAAIFTKFPDLAAQWSCGARPPHGANYARVCDRTLDDELAANRLDLAVPRLYAKAAFHPIVAYSEVVGIGRRVRGFAPPEYLVPLTFHAERWNVG